jgi:hypothetical protein
MVRTEYEMESLQRNCKAVEASYASRSSFAFTAAYNLARRLT